MRVKRLAVLIRTTPILIALPVAGLPVPLPAVVPVTPPVSIALLVPVPVSFIPLLFREAFFRQC